MIKQVTNTRSHKTKNGFNLTELTIATAILGMVASIAYPNYISSRQRAQCSEVKSTLASIPPIISAYIDKTGESPTTWGNLSSIAVVMTSNGPATGDLTNPITLPRTNYELKVDGPSESTYLLTANCFIKTTTDDPTKEEEDPDKDKYVIRSCFNVSNGASDLTSGSGTDIANTPNCG